MKSYILSKTVAFVRHPRKRGLWMNTHPCVVMVECPMCHAKKGEPCKSQPWSEKYTSGTHAVRREAIKDINIYVGHIEVYLPTEVSHAKKGDE